MALKKLQLTKTAKVGRHRYLAKDCADYCINRGGKELMAEDEGNRSQRICIYSTKKLSELQKKLLPETVAVKDSDFIKIRFNRIAPKGCKK